MEHHNAEKTCWNCPCIDFKGNVDFRACGQSMKQFLGIKGEGDMQAMVECKRRPEIGMFDPASITFEDCPEWQQREFGYVAQADNEKHVPLGKLQFLKKAM